MFVAIKFMYQSVWFKVTYPFPLVQLKCEWIKRCNAEYRLYVMTIQFIF